MAIILLLFAANRDAVLDKSSQIDLVSQLFYCHSYQLFKCTEDA